MEHYHLKQTKELYGPAMEITNSEEADAYLKELVNYYVELGNPPDRAEDIVRTNLSWYAGYFDHETRLRVERLFDCQHPILGEAADAEPSPNTTLLLGAALERKGEFDEKKPTGI